MQFAIAIIGLIFILISVHELGHYWAARCFAIKIERISVGFGQPFYSYTSAKTGIEYVLARWPVGGYVRLLNTREKPCSAADRSYAFDQKPIWQRVCVLCAGSVANVLLAIVLFSWMYCLGIYQYKPWIGHITQHSIAAQSGLQPGEQILKVDGRAVQGWQDVLLAMFRRVGETTVMQLTVREPNGRVRDVVLPLERWKLKPLDPGPIQSLGIQPYLPKEFTRLKSVSPASAAARAGLKAGDQILAVDQHAVQSWSEIKTYMQQLKPKGAVQLRVLRDQHIVNVTLTLSQFEIFTWYFGSMHWLGMRPQHAAWPSAAVQVLQYPLLQALRHATVQLMDFASFNYLMLWKILTGKLSLQSLGGPLSIFAGAYLALGQGIKIFLGFSALLSMGLAIANLLPIPGLDGGHLLFLCIEKVRKRPISVALEVLIYRLSLIAIVVFMIQLLLNDSMRMLERLRQGIF